MIEIYLLGILWALAVFAIRDETSPRATLVYALAWPLVLVVYVLCALILDEWPDP